MCAFSKDRDTEDSIHILTLKEKAHSDPQKVQGTCSNTVRDNPYFSNTLVRKYFAQNILQVKGGFPQWGPEMQVQLHSQGQSCSMVKQCNLAPCNYCHLYNLRHSDNKCQATIQVTFLKNIFITGKCL